MKAMRIGLVVLLALVVVVAFDRALVAWQNAEIVSPKDGFARWPSGEFMNPLVTERLARFDASVWGRLGVPCSPPGFCDARTFGWTSYVRFGGEEFVSFFDAARRRTASLHFKREMGESFWQKCSGSWTSCAPAWDPPQVNWAVEDGRKLLVKAARKNS